MRVMMFTKSTMMMSMRIMDHVTDCLDGTRVDLARSSAAKGLCRLPVSYCDYDAFAESMSGLQLFRSALLVSVLFGGERT